MVCTFISFFGLASTGTSGSVSVNFLVLSVKEGILVSLLLRVCVVILNSITYLICYREWLGNKLHLSRRSWRVHWSRCESQWYSYKFDIRLVCSVESIVKPGRKILRDGAVLTDLKLTEVPVVFVEGESMSLPEVKSQVLQLLSTRYPFSLEESLVVASEAVASIHALTSDMDCEDD